MEPWKELKLTKNKNECARLYLLIKGLDSNIDCFLDEIILYDIKNITTTKDIKMMEKFLKVIYTRFYNKWLDKQKKI